MSANRSAQATLDPMAGLVGPCAGSYDNPRHARMCECANHAFAATTKGYVALVSPEDMHLLDSKWCAMVGHAGAQVVKRIGGDRVNMARMLLGAPPDLQVDHINRNESDNRRENIRLATRSQNQQNRRRPRGRVTGLPKCVYATREGTFRAVIFVEGKSRYLGTHGTPEKAFEAYCMAAAKHFGEFARFE